MHFELNKNYAGEKIYLEIKEFKSHYCLTKSLSQKEEISVIHRKILLMKKLMIKRKNHRQNHHMGKGSKGMVIFLLLVWCLETTR